jgi:transcriptional regulator with XRE-family HTH domain
MKAKKYSHKKNSEEINEKEYKVKNRGCIGSKSGDKNYVTGLNVKKLGEEIKRVRSKVMKITQVELAKKVGVSQGMISSLEKGGTQEPDKDYLEKICKKLNISLEKFRIYNKDGIVNTGKDFLRRAIYKSVKDVENESFASKILKLTNPDYKENLKPINMKVEKSLTDDYVFNVLDNFKSENPEIEELKLLKPYIKELLNNPNEIEELISDPNLINMIEEINSLKKQASNIELKITEIAKEGFAKLLLEDYFPSKLNLLNLILMLYFNILPVPISDGRVFDFDDMKTLGINHTIGFQYNCIPNFPSPFNHNFLIRVLDDSMNLCDIYHGDYVMVEAAKEVENGDITVFEYIGKVIKIRKYIKDETTEKFITISNNTCPDESIIYSSEKESIRVIGKVVGVQRQFNKTDFI